MIGGLISNVLSAGAGNGLITSALCMQTKKSSTAKLIIRFDLYEILKSDLSGFYDTVTPLSRVNIKFVVLDLLRNVVYTSPNNNFTNDTAVELPNGQYIIKFLFSTYGFVGGEEQAVTVNGETIYKIKLYKRHFKAVTVNDEYDTYDGTQIGERIGLTGGTEQANEVIGISKIDVYELKWDKWEKVLNYDCVPPQLSKVQTHSEDIITEFGQRARRFYDIFYINGFITNKSGLKRGGWGTGPLQPFSEEFIGWEGDAILMSKTEDGKTSTYRIANPLNTWFSSLNYIYNAVILYHDGKTYSGVDDVDDDFYLKYAGETLLKHDVETTDVMYKILDPRTHSSMSLVKIYLPTINYFNEDLLKEREIAEQHGNDFWRNNLGSVKIEENGVVQNYNSKMLYNRLEVTKINSVNNFAWYSKDY